MGSYGWLFLSQRSVFSYASTHTQAHLVCLCLKQLRTNTHSQENESEREKCEFQLPSRCIYNVEGQKFAHWTQAKIEMLYICTHIDARSITALYNLSRETTQRERVKDTVFSLSLTDNCPIAQVTDWIRFYIMHLLFETHMSNGDNHTPARLRARIFGLVIHLF